MYVKNCKDGTLSNYMCHDCNEDLVIWATFATIKGINDLMNHTEHKNRLISLLDDSSQVL